MKVEFGARELANGQWVPFIAFIPNDNGSGRVEFKADKLCKDKTEASIISEGSYIAMQLGIKTVTQKLIDYMYQNN